MSYSKERAGRAIRFIEKLKHTKAPYRGKPFVLAKFQKKIIEELFGTVNDDGTRQYRKAYIEMPRKGGKSELAAGIALYTLFDGEGGDEVYGCAGDRDQASIVFDVAAEMVRLGDLSNRFKIIDTRKRIVYPAKGSFYHAISAEAATKHGYNATAVIFDELHVQPNRHLWDVMTTSGGTRKEPLIFAITTAGFDRNSICWEQHAYAEAVLKGVVADPSFYPVIYSAPENADWKDEKVWAACNPALGDFRSIEEMRSLFREAEQTPALENTFRRLYLCQWTQQEKRWMPIEAWDATAGAVDPAALEGKACYAGLDLASTSDIAAFVATFPDGDGFSTLGRFWIPEENVAARVKKDRVPYDVWIREGLISTTPGNVIDYRTIYHDIVEMRERFDIREIAYDRWGATQLVQELEGEGFTMVPFGQGFASMAAPTKELMALVLSKKLHHGGNPVLRWMANNMVVRQDPAGNLKPDKGKSTEKIDGMVALIMGLDRAMRHGNQVSVYEERGAIIIS
jgi:phage terminase large subunit-like protein